MRSPARQFHHLYSFQMELWVASLIEETQTCAQEHRHDVNVEFVSQPGSQALLCDVGGTNHGHIFVARSRFSLPDGAFYTIRHEGESQVVVFLGVLFGGWWVSTKIGTWYS